MTSPLGEAALHYHFQGLRIFPLVPNQKAPYLTGTQGYKLYKRAKAEGLTEAEVRSFWADNEKANIGLWPGNKSGLSAIDIDVDEFGDGNTRLAELGAEHGFNVLDGSALVVLSPSSAAGGRHLYWRYTARLPELFNRKSYRPDDIRHGYGFDIRNGHEGYIVLPPSTTEDGFYRFENGMGPTAFGQSLLKRFPYEGPWFSLLVVRNRKKGRKSSKPDYWQRKVKRQIKEAQPLYDALNEFLDKYGEYRAKDKHGKTIIKKGVKQTLEKLVDSLKKKRILTMENGIVLAKPPGHLLHWYPLDFRNCILVSEMEDAINAQIPRGAKHHFHTFDDGSVKVYWKSHRKEPRWIPVNFGRSGSNGVTWQEIVKRYL